MRKIFFNSNHRVRPFWRLVLFLSITFIINIPLQIILQEVLDQGLLRGIISGTIYFASVIISLFIQIKYLDKSSFKKYGLQINNVWLKEFGIGMLIALFQLLIFFGILYATDNIDILDFFTTNSPNYSFIAGLLSELFGLIIGSTVEEIFFRAFLFYVFYEALRIFKKDPNKRAFLILVLISPLFGLAHAGNDGATTLSTINLGLDAMMMCLPFLITGRLGMSIGMHLSWNFVQGVILGFPISGNIAKVNFISINTTDNVLTGGAFGLEGSILLILLDIIAVVLILYWKKRNNYGPLVNPYIIENDTY